MNISKWFTKHELQNFVLFFAGVVLFAISINLFSIRYDLINAGMVGFAIILAKFIPFSVGIILFVINSVIILFAYRFVGKETAIKAIIGYTLTSIAMDVIGSCLNFGQVEISNYYNQIVIIIISGITAAFGIALVIKSGYSLGNYTTLFVIVKQRINITTPVFFFICDLLLAVITYFLMGFQSACLILINTAVFSISLEVYLRILSLFQKKSV
jgi:uncharacterized membrane-anchored protein YitT (DUF2179 family)